MLYLSLPFRLFVSVFLVLLTLSHSQALELNQYNANRKGLVLDGYDVVAYFDDRRPRKGLAVFEHQWNGVTWRFVSNTNKQKFAANPERYAPQFGGYCAWAVSKGEFADVNPRVYRIIDDKLYLNFNSRIQAKWLKDKEQQIEQANVEWPKMLEGDVIQRGS